MAEIEIDARVKIQNQALQNWIGTGCKGTVLMPTGTGKSFVAIKAILYIKQQVKDVINVLHLSERTNREAGFEKQISIFESMSGDVRTGVIMHYYRYQGYNSIPTNIKYDLVICDEIHESLTPSYFDVYYRIKYDALIGLTATIPYAKYTLPDGTLISKYQLLQLHSPVVYNCTVKTAQENNAVRENNLFFIRCQLTESELDTYNAISAKILIFKDTLKAKTLGNTRLTFLNRTADKLKITKRLIDMNEYHKLPSIIFNTDLDSLKMLLPNSYISGSNKSAYKDILENFQKQYYTIGSFKMLKQGENIDGLLNCIILSSNTTNLRLDTIQRVGRLRKDNNIKGNVIVLINDDTLEFNFIKKISDILCITDFHVCDNFKQFYDKYKDINNI